jgi:type IV secretion system protein VirB4
VRRLDALRAELGDEPAAWYPALTGAPWPATDAGAWIEAAE